MKERLSLPKCCIAAFVAAVAALAICMATAMPAFAANGSVNGGTTTFKKHLVMESQANVPNVTFEFEVTAGEPVSASGSNPAIYAGVGPDQVSVEKAEFKASDSGQATDGKPSDGTGSVSDGYKYATKNVTVDFSRVSFTAPGIYRYIVTEQASSASGITNDDKSTRTIDVHVIYDEGSEPQLRIAGYVMYSGTVTGNTNLNSNKSSEYVNKYETNDLTLEKQVTGNQGDRNKYFEFTVSISGAVPGTVYDVDLHNAEESPSVEGSGKTNSGTLTADDGTVTATYYLKHGQSIVIQGLAPDTKYEITETAYAEDGYSTSFVIDSNDSNVSFGTGIQVMNGGDHKVLFTNYKNGTVPTGILLEVAPYIGLGVAVLVSLALLIATRRRRAGE